MGSCESVFSGQSSGLAVEFQKKIWYDKANEMEDFAVQYLVDLHVHTAQTSPCGKVSAQDIVRGYLASEYRGIFIMDHYFPGFFQRLGDIPWNEKMDAYLKGYRAACKAAEGTSLRVYFGIELRFQENINDYLVYGVTPEFLYENPELFRLNVRDFYPIAQKNGFVICQAHPFRDRMERAPADCLDGVEIANMHPGHDSRNHLALEFAKENGLRMIGGSDLHRLPHFRRGGVWLDTLPKDEREFAALLRDNRIVKVRNIL